MTGVSIWMFVWTLVLLPLSYVLYHVVAFFLDMRRRAKIIDQFPHDPKHWLWGHLHQYPGLTDEGLAFERSQTITYPRVQSSWIGNYIRPFIQVKHPDTVKLILKTTEPKPLGFGLYSYGLPWIGEGLLLASGAKWARNRRLLTPAFHFDILKNYISVKNDAVEIFLNKLSEQEGKSFEFFSHISLLTFDIILRCACSYENNVQVEGENHPYVQAVNKLGEMWVQRCFKPWQHFNIIYRLTGGYNKFKRHCDFVHSISEQVIKQRRTFLEENGPERRKYLDFLDILLTARDEDNKGLTDREIRDEVDTFLFEGHDTTASSISWALYSLAENPEHQRNCQEEIDEVLSGRSSDYIDCDDLPKLKYLTMCIKESMRCHCPVPFIERETTEDFTLDGIIVPKRTVIDIPIYSVHHNPVVWDEPMEFRPSRFLPENFDKMDNFAFIPFSAGPRNCIGQNFAMHEQKIVLARILRRFTIELDPTFKVEKRISVVIKTINGMYMKAIPR